jgi:hypothetical protein
MAVTRYDKTVSRRSHRANGLLGLKPANNPARRPATSHATSCATCRRSPTTRANISLCRCRSRPEAARRAHAGSSVESLAHFLFCLAVMELIEQIAKVSHRSTVWRTKLCRNQGAGFALCTRSVTHSRCLSEETAYSAAIARALWRFTFCHGDWGREARPVVASGDRDQHMASVKRAGLSSLIVGAVLGAVGSARQSAPVVTQNPDAVVVYAAGMAPCSTWIASRKARLRDDIRAEQLKAFLYGYATAINVIAMPLEPSLDGHDGAHIDAFLDSYCAAHPQDIFLRAVQELIDEIHPASAK